MFPKHTLFPDCVYFSGCHHQRLRLVIDHGYAFLSDKFVTTLVERTFKARSGKSLWEVPHGETDCSENIHIDVGSHYLHL